MDGLDKFRSSVNWNAADVAGQVNALVRRAMVDYVSAYMKSGDAALVTYNDRSEPVSLKQQWRSLLAGSPYFQQYSPALRDYLEQYPRKKLPGATDVLYWVKEDYTGLKPVISIVHGVIYMAPEHPERIVVRAEATVCEPLLRWFPGCGQRHRHIRGRRTDDVSALRQPVARRSAQRRVRRPQAQDCPRTGEKRARSRRSARSRACWSKLFLGRGEQPSLMGSSGALGPAPIVPHRYGRSARRAGTF